MRNNRQVRASVEIFRIFGIPVRVDSSWLLILLLITYSLASGYFPGNLPGLATLSYWGMGFVGAIALFASILFHELSHALVARHFQIKIDGITLFIFGGVAQMEDEAATPKAEFLMAGVGPIASLVLAGGFYGAQEMLDRSGANPALMLLFYYLYIMNLVLALFNLVPAFPLDGGRVFRSLLWAVQKDYFRATRMASWVGQGFAWLLIGLGALRVLSGSFLGGLWMVFIGFFLKKAGDSTLAQLDIRTLMEKIPVENIMKGPGFAFHPADSLISVGNYLGDTVSATHFPVVEGAKLIGYLSLSDLEKLSLETWESGKVADFLKSDVAILMIAPQANAWQALRRMRSARVGNLFISLDDRLLGVMTIDDLLNYYQALKEASPKS